MNKGVNPTLCWICKKAGGLCSWSENFTPVEGWKAEPTKVWVGATSVESYTDSYRVIECPKFELLDTVKYNEIERTKWLDLIAKNMSKSDTNT